MSEKSVLREGLTPSIATDDLDVKVAMEAMRLPWLEIRSRCERRVLFLKKTKHYLSLEQSSGDEACGRVASKNGFQLQGLEMVKIENSKR